MSCVQFHFDLSGVLYLFGVYRAPLSNLGCDRLTLSTQQLKKRATVRAASLKLLHLDRGECGIANVHRRCKWVVDLITSAISALHIQNRFRLLGDKVSVEGERNALLGIQVGKR